MIVKEVIADYPGARRDAESLLLHCLERDDRAWLIAHDTDEVADAALAAFDALSKRRLGGEPMAYLLGYREFWSLTLKVTPDVLIPRPETEYVVEWVLELTASTHASSLLDLGTGSGAIALACKHACPSLQVTATDVSEAALAVAADNASDLGLAIELKVSNWFSTLADRHWPLIASNPPYIAATDPHLTSGDLHFEPRSALTDEHDGLADMKEIITQAPDHLEPGGWLLLEHGYDQAAAVAQCMTARGFHHIALRHDMAGRPRVTGGRWLA